MNMRRGFMARILVVEDYANLQLIYEEALTTAGYKVDVTGDGLDALDVAAKHQPDLILLDLLLPHMGGLEFLKAYDLAQHPAVKVVVFSNLYSPNLLEEAKQLGVVYYLTKADFTPEELVEFVTKVLNEKTPPTKNPAPKQQ
jgi:two-component system response regulator (stage 0 sporulation protein F)